MFALKRLLNVKVLALLLFGGAALATIASPKPKTVYGASTCVYAGQTYSQGAQLDNGQVCQDDGTWSKVKVSM